MFLIIAIFYYFLGKQRNVHPQLGLNHFWMVPRSIRVHSTGEFTEALLTGTTPDQQHLVNCDTTMCTVHVYTPLGWTPHPSCRVKSYPTQRDVLSNISLGVKIIFCLLRPWLKWFTSTSRAWADSSFDPRNKGYETRGWKIANCQENNIFTW